MSETIIEKPHPVWNFVHTGTGFLSGVLGVPPVVYGILAVGYEVIENIGGGALRKAIYGTDGPETIQDTLTDLVLGTSGYIAGAYLRKRSV